MPVASTWHNRTTANTAMFFLLWKHMKGVRERLFIIECGHDSFVVVGVLLSRCAHLATISRPLCIAPWVADRSRTASHIPNWWLEKRSCDQAYCLAGYVNGQLMSKNDTNVVWLRGKLRPLLLATNRRLKWKGVHVADAEQVSCYELPAKL